MNAGDFDYWFLYSQNVDFPTERYRRYPPLVCTPHSVPEHGTGIWWAVSVRLALAVSLWFSAPISRTPISFKVLAIVAVMGAVYLMVIGSEGMLEIIDWFASWPLWGVRLQSTVGGALGLFLLWSIFSRRADA